MTKSNDKLATNKNNNKNKKSIYYIIILIILLALLLLGYCKRKDDKAIQETPPQSSIKEKIRKSCQERLNSSIELKSKKIDIEKEFEVHFEFDSDEISDEELIKIVSIVSRIEKINTIRLTGYADARGSKEYNKALSTRRVNAIKKCFESLSVKTNFELENWGEDHPTAFGTNKEAYSKNRRVKVEIE
ncbi:OmpA family protein [Bacteriovorax sp. BAL6_X]|uniref:OmpA family protein n=1 Tax=Bacteriovorax sp. BAL6_X TaxID=1201290 RepID=UPI000386A0BE|nr:OmpA family protein [Bacteriovorax sp. BAL6_X]EPZ49210.1 OmpA family protein [Bacteriovorax sp. BAL6_X]